MKVRRDWNETEIVRALGRAGARVFRVKIAEPAGLPDLAVYFRGRWFMLEVKAADGVLSESQVVLIRLGASRVVRSPLEALEAIGAVRTAPEPAGVED